MRKLIFKFTKCMLDKNNYKFVLTTLLFQQQNIVFYGKLMCSYGHMHADKRWLMLCLFCSSIAWFTCTVLIHRTEWRIYASMLCTAKLPGPVLKAFGWVQISPFQMADKSPMITDQLTAGGSVSQLSQLAKLSPWLTISTKDVTTSFWHYKKLFVFFLSNQIMGL